MLSLASTSCIFTLSCRTWSTCTVWCCCLNFVTFVKSPKHIQSCRRDRWRRLLDFMLHEWTLWSVQTSSTPVERNLKSTLKWSACCGRINMHERNFIRAKEDWLQVCVCVCVCVCVSPLIRVCLMFTLHLLIFTWWTVSFHFYLSTSFTAATEQPSAQTPDQFSPPAQFFLGHLRLQTGFPVCVWGRSRILRTTPTSAPSTGSGWYVYWDVNWDCAWGSQGQQWTHSSSPSLSVALLPALIVSDEQEGWAIAKSWLILFSLTVKCICWGWAGLITERRCKTGRLQIAEFVLWSVSSHKLTGLDTEYTSSLLINTHFTACRKQKYFCSRGQSWRCWATPQSPQRL